MSNRGQYVGTGPTSGNYIPSPVPNDQEDLPVYVNDELLRLGGAVNGMLEGGALPPHSELPKRFREGMIMNFSQAVSDAVNSSGVWLYKKNKWWKLIDDPTTITGLNFIYKLTTEDTTPSKPEPSGRPPAGWSVTPPQKNNKTDYIWACTNISYDEDTDLYEWGNPYMYSAGVTDGAVGRDGSTGSGFYQAEYANIDWTEPTATDRFYNLVGRQPVQHDIFIQTKTDKSVSEGREYDGVAWSPAGLYISGSIIASGTIAGDRFQAGTRIQAGNGNASASLDGADPLWRIYAGSDVGANANFRVDKDGNLFANTGTFGGKIFADKVAGDITDVITKSVAEGEVSFAGGSSGYAQRDLFTLAVDSAEPYLRMIKVDPMAFAFTGAPVSQGSAYNHILVYAQPLDPVTGDPQGPEEQLVGFNKFKWPVYDEDEHYSVSPTIAFPVEANLKYRYRIVIGVTDDVNTGKLVGQTLIASIFKEGSTFSFV